MPPWVWCQAIIMVGVTVLLPWPSLLEALWYNSIRCGRYTVLRVKHLQYSTASWYGRWEMCTNWDKYCTSLLYMYWVILLHSTVLIRSILLLGEQIVYCTWQIYAAWLKKNLRFRLHTFAGIDNKNDKFSIRFTESEQVVVVEVVVLNCYHQTLQNMLSKHNGINVLVYFFY